MTDTINERLARIETKLDRALRDREDQEKRLRNVEIRQVYWSGAGSAIGLIFGWMTKGHFS